VGKVIVLTGASDGIGAAAAAALGEAGHTLILVGRSPAKTKAVANRVGAARYFTADFADLIQVRRMARRIRLICPRIDVLANNAGGVFTGPRMTADGYEYTFQVNALAGLQLTHDLLEPLLVARGAVVNTGSLAARLLGRLEPDHLDGRRFLTPMRAYGDSKLASVIFARGLHQRYNAEGLSAVAFHPGVIATNIASEKGLGLHYVYHSPLRRLLTPAARGGTNLAYFAAGVAGATWESGRYYSARRQPVKSNPQVWDQALCDAVWDRCSELLDLDWL
jgi:NAD(P)-dependent dehydrogenase (short-subunit alcohol dehydrogenase family)